MKHIAIIGASGAIGAALIAALLQRSGTQAIYAFSRTRITITDTRIQHCILDITEESSIQAAARFVQQHTPMLDAVLITTGLLHRQPELMPEKALKELNAAHMLELYHTNAVAPALIAKHFLPLLPRKERSVFMALAARVGSIGDNRTGGWHSYRAAKAALVMLLKNIAIEMARTHPELIVCALHPGTVDSGLSSPFQKHVAPGQLHTPEQTAIYLLEVLANLTPAHSGQHIDWQGKQIDW